MCLEISNSEYRFLSSSSLSMYVCVYVSTFVWNFAFSLKENVPTDSLPFACLFNFLVICFENGEKLITGFSRKEVPMEKNFTEKKFLLQAFTVF